MFLVPTSNFQFRNASEFIDYIKSGDANLYAFVSRSQPWDNAPEVPTTVLSDREQRETWDDMMFLRRVRESDIVPGIRKVSWESGTVYQIFDDTVDLTDTNHYIFTEPENNVYICIDNNGGAPSTVKPSHRDENVVEESDGYKWKFMTTISPSLIDKFILNDFIPLETTPEIAESASPGSIEHLVVENSGSGYPVSRTVGTSDELPIFIQGNGTQVSTAEASITVIQGSITSINLTDGGSGHFFGPGVEFPIALRQVTPNGTVQNAYGIATTDLDGAIDSVDVVIPGSGYQDGSVTIIQSSGEGYAETNEDGEVINAEMRIGRAGSDFFKASGIVVSEQGSGAIIRPIISPDGGFGINQLKQLHSHYALISIEVDTIDALSVVSLDDFRRIGLISDPLEYSSDPLSSDGLVDSDGGPVYDSDGEFVGTSLSVDTADAKHMIVLNENNESFENDETIVGQSSGTIGLYASKFETNSIRYTVDDSFINVDDIDFEIGEQVRGLTSNATATVSDVLAPDVEKYSGEIYHINNIEPIVRSDDQRILLTFVLNY